MESLKLHVTDEKLVMNESRKPTEVPDNASDKPNPEVTPKVKRRYLTIAYKLKVLDTVAELREQGHGAIGAYLRKEGLYYSSISSWEKLRDQGLLTSARKGSRENNHDKVLAENKKLRRELKKTRKRLAKNEMIIELQKKLSAILEIEMPKPTGKSETE